MKWRDYTKTVTIIVIPLLVLAILIYDVIAIEKGGVEASISWLIITSSYKMPLIPFVIGFFLGLLGGHLWWRMRNVEGTDKLGKE